jgi:hypothetical protein
MGAVRTTIDGETAPANDATHPAVVERITKDMLATAAVLDTANAQLMAADDPWKAIQHLRGSVEALYVEAEGYRDDTAKTFRPVR